MLTQARAVLIRRRGKVSRSWFLAAVVVTSCGLLLAWVAWFLVGNWQVRKDLARAKEQIHSGHHRRARDRLARLSAWWPRHGEVEYLLGVCESMLGRTDAALAAWARVPVTSPLAASAALSRGRVLARSNSRFIEAEAAYRAAALGTGARAIEARWALATLLLWEGRLDEVRSLLEEIWRIGHDRDRTAALREMWRLDAVIVAANEIQPVLDQAARVAPDDDRVWLARAYLALRYGRCAVAHVWLDASLQKHPEDPVVWRRTCNVHWLQRILPRCCARWPGFPSIGSRCLSGGRSARGWPRIAATPMPSAPPSSVSSRSIPAIPRDSIDWSH